MDKILSGTMMAVASGEILPHGWLPEMEAL